VRVLTVLIAFTLTAFGQRHTVTEVNAETPDGKVLAQIMQSGDPAQKTALLEQFVDQFPKAGAAPWAMEQLLAAYVKAGQPDKVLSIGQKLLAVDPDETEAALQCLKASEARKDLEDVKKYSALSSTLAKKMQAAPQPAEAEAVDTWKQEREYATQVDVYAEYSLYRVFAESRDPKVTIEFGELIPQRYPGGQYAGKLDEVMFLAYRQAGQADKALALAERLIAANTTNEDMYLVVVDNYLNNKKQPEKVHAYCSKLVELMNTKPKPDAVAAGVWSTRKDLIIGQAHYMNGKLFFNENRFPECDKELAASLPLVESNPAAKAEVLFLLGFANYKMEKPQEAANYYRTCAAMKSDYQAKAVKNLAVLKGQYTGIK
jgi:DNA-binding SARP family transcriptional activator